MKYAERQTRTMLMSLFQENGFHPRTDLGQNFLIDLNLIEYILDSAELCRDDVVLEIGTGTGGLTTALASRAGAVVTVEVDHRVFALAAQVVAHLKNVTLLNCDALKNKNHFSQTVLDAIGDQLAVSQHRRLKLVANLPYCIATPVISNLVASEIPWESMIVTIQLEELAEQDSVETLFRALRERLSVWITIPVSGQSPQEAQAHGVLAATASRLGNPANSAVAGRPRTNRRSKLLSRLCATTVPAAQEILAERFDRHVSTGFDQDANRPGPRNAHRSKDGVQGRCVRHRDHRQTLSRDESPILQCLAARRTADRGLHFTEQPSA